MAFRAIFLAATLALASCATPADDPFASAYQDELSAADLGDATRAAILRAYPPERSQLAEVERYLEAAGAQCRPAQGVALCRYTLLRQPKGNARPGRKDGAFVDYDVDLIPDGQRLKDVRVVVN